MSTACKICPVCKTPTELDSLVCQDCGHRYRTKFAAPEDRTTVSSRPIPQGPPPAAPPPEPPGRTVAVYATRPAPSVDPGPVTLTLYPSGPTTGHQSLSRKRITVACLVMLLALAAVLYAGYRGYERKSLSAELPPPPVQMASRPAVEYPPARPSLHAADAPSPLETAAGMDDAPIGTVMRGDPFEQGTERPGSYSAPAPTPASAPGQNTGALPAMRPANLVGTWIDLRHSGSTLSLRDDGGVSFSAWQRACVSSGWQATGSDLSIPTDIGTWHFSYALTASNNILMLTGGPNGDSTTWYRQGSNEAREASRNPQ